MAKPSLLYAYRTCNDPLIARLLAKGNFDVNEVSAEGYTPLHFAADSGNVAHIKRLLELGARADVRDDNRELPVQWAKTAAARACLPAAPLEKKVKPPPTSLANALARVTLGKSSATFALRALGDRKPREYQLFVFDWREVRAKSEEFFGDTFNDGFVDGYLLGGKWTSEEVVPFAFARLRPFRKSFAWPTDDCAAILFFQLKRGNGKTCPVVYVWIEGTANPDGFTPLAKTIESLKLSPQGRAMT